MVKGPPDVEQTPAERRKQAIADLLDGARSQQPRSPQEFIPWSEPIQRELQGAGQEYERFSTAFTACLAGHPGWQLPDAILALQRLLVNVPT